MKTKIVRITAYLILLSWIFSMIAACNISNNDEKDMTGNDVDVVSKTSSGLDISKRVELQFYMVGDPPKDLPKIQARINQMAMKELNATVVFNFTTWTDWDHRYNLLLTSGQSIDLIFTSEWAEYQAYAKQGAFLALDELLPAVVPELYDFVPQDYWDAVRIDGKIQTIPATWKEYVTGGIAYREDLRVKHELPIPSSIENLEIYLEGIKQNESNVTPIGNTESKHMGPYMDLKYEPAGTTEHGVPYGLIIPYDNPLNIIQYYGSDDHLEDLKRMKSWMDKGYWTRNILSMKDSAPGLLQNGRAAAIIGENPTRFNDSVLRIASTDPEWELGYFPFPNSKGYATSVHPIHNGFAIPKSSSHPERALAFYEKMVLDKRYNWLTSYGIEGTHFEVVDGFYKMIGTSETNGFPREGMNSWAWRNPEFMLFDSSFQNVQELFNGFDQIASPDYFTGFAEDWTSYQAEKAALEQVSAQYLWPLNVGLIDDVEAGLEIFMDKAKQAGLEKIQADYTKQWLLYIEETGLTR